MSTERDYFAGSCTRAEARAAHLSDDPAIRAARIVRLFTTADARINESIRLAVTNQSTRKRITPKLRNDLATALILRATADDPARTDQVRRYMRHAFGQSVHYENWEGTDRDTELLLNEALKDVRHSIGDQAAAATSSASIELCVRAAYPLIVSGRLSADRGTANNAQPDRRHPGEVLEAMRRTIQRVYQLAQALRDFANDGQQIRAVDENGQVKKRPDGAGEQMVNDIYLRTEYPPPGKARAPRTGDTPSDQYENRLSDFAQAVERLEQSLPSQIGGRRCRNSTSASRSRPSSGELEVQNIHYYC